MVDKIIDYECGMMSEEEMVYFFSELIQTGLVWELQGHYGRTAMSLIEAGVLDASGEVLFDFEGAIA